MLLHGLGADRRQPLELFGPVLGTGTVVAPEVRAHGGSEVVGAPEDFALGRLAREVAAEVGAAPSARDGRPLTLVGVSMGAAIALRIASDGLLPVERAVFVRPAFDDRSLPPHLHAFPVIGELLRESGPVAGARRFLGTEPYRRVEAESPRARAGCSDSSGRRMPRRAPSVSSRSHATARSAPTPNSARSPPAGCVRSWSAHRGTPCTRSASPSGGRAGSVHRWRACRPATTGRRARRQPCARPSADGSPPVERIRAIVPENGPMGGEPMTESMRALVVDETGEGAAFRMADVPRPLRVLDEVLVRVVAAGVNPIDRKTRLGRGLAPAITGYPAVLGLDFAGVVEEVPYAAHALQPGDRVYGMARVPRTWGSYAEYATVGSLSVAPMPSSTGFVEAAAIPCAALTAWGAVVDVARVHDGQRVLIHAGAGGVGHFAVQLAAYFGAHVTATGSPRNAEFLASLGARHVIDYTAERFEEVAGEQDVVIDLIGNVADDTGTRSLEVLRPGGLVVNVPTKSWPTMAEEAAARGIRSTGFTLAPDARTLAIVSRLVDDGALRVHVDEVFDLADGEAAHERLGQGHVRGKIVLRVADDAG
ncbi:hypothetical protein GCM10025870_12830 [Agromyces marinus]|uniref:Enoyl reductase (ER) domain-containing protein n=1 Tax=Agromyces marinus TaxID=1389020 RepID=A0ABN6YDW7_9MICO|nr:hypothetical protein GCM10025870_12830 [Agromyces marinus]